MGWLVTCTKASRLTDPPEIRVYVDTFLTRVPGEQGAKTTACNAAGAAGGQAPGGAVRTDRRGGGRMKPTVEYVPCDPPKDLGLRYHDFRPVGHEFLYGLYRVQLDDGFTYLSPHAALEGTISVEPVDLDINPEFVQSVIEHAERVRAAQEGMDE